jgi:hypothetical protein
MSLDDGLPEGHVEIETSVTPREDGTLEVFYQVTNEIECPILLTTPLSLLNKNVVRAVEERVYTYVDPEGVLHVTKRLWMVPDALDIFWPEVPFATEVGSGKQFAERLWLRLPIQIEYPYRATETADTTKSDRPVTQAQGFAFSIGYLIEMNGPLHNGSAGPESGASLLVTYSTAARNQRILQGEILMIGVPVRD